MNFSNVAKTLQFTVETAFGAGGLKIDAMWQIVPTRCALKDDFYPEEYAEKPLKEKHLKNLLRKF